MVAQLFYLPFDPVFTSRGLPAGAATVTFYERGTTTLAPIYADAAFAVPLPNPVAADALGRLPSIYLDSNIQYRVRVRDVLGVEIGDVDPYVPGTFVGGPGPAGPTGAPGGDTMSIGLFTGSTGTLIKVGTDLVQTSGYSTVGKGYARYSYDPTVNAAYVSANPRTSFMARADAVEAQPSRGFRLAERQTFPEMLGAIGDNATDDFAALQAWLNFGGSLKMDRRAYYCTQRLEVRNYVQVVGAGAGFDARKTYVNMPGSRIRFRINAGGIIVRPQWNLEGTATPQGPPEQEGGFGSTFENLVLLGGGGTAPVIGFESRTRVFLRNIRAIGFTGESGIVLWGSADTPDNSSPYGNVSCSGVEFCHVSESGGGFRFAGRDSSVIAVNGCDAISNSGWGYEDTTIFGVTYTGCHAAGNSSIVDGQRVGGSYRSASIVGVTEYLNCYVEGDVGARCDIVKPHKIVGGGLASAPNINVNPAAREPKRAYTIIQITTPSTTGFVPDMWAFEVRKGCFYTLRVNGNYNHPSSSPVRFGIRATDGFAGTIRGSLFAATAENVTERKSLSDALGFDNPSSFIEATPADGSPYYLPFGGEVDFECTSSGTISFLIGTSSASDATLVPNPARAEMIEV